MFAYLLLDGTLDRRDRLLVETEVKSLQEQYQIGGRMAFNTQVAENDRLRKNNPFFTRVIDAPGHKGFIFFPQYSIDFDLSSLDGTSSPTPGSWIEVESREGNYALEIFTARQSDGNLFQIGISSEDRKAVLRRFRETFLAVSLPLILLAVGSGALFSKRVLRPVRNLIVAVASIEAGQMDARVPETRTGDELDDLSRLFNRMIEKINQLIGGMRDALDSVAHDLRTPMTHFRNPWVPFITRLFPPADTVSSAGIMPAGWSPISEFLIVTL